MKRQSPLYDGIVVMAFLLLFLLKSPIPYDILARPQEGELNFTTTPEKIHVKKEENFEINLTL